MAPLLLVTLRAMHGTHSTDVHMDTVSRFSYQPLHTARSIVEPSTSLAAGARRFFCAAMPWVDCTELRYHCTRQPGVDLCPQAFAEGRFPQGCSAADFVRLEGGADANAPDAGGGAGRWTPQETLLCVGARLHAFIWRSRLL